MFPLVYMFMVMCGVAAKPQCTQTPTLNTTTTNPTTPATTPMPQQPARCPTKDSLLADLARLSKIHFAVLQTDHQGYYKALKWNLDAAFTSLEAQFTKRITHIQQDTKDQLDKVQKEMEALKSQHTAMTSQLADIQNGIQKQISGLAGLQSLVKKTIRGPDACIRGKLLSNVCYQIFMCKPPCSLTTAKQMCPKFGATLAPLRTQAIFNLVKAQQSELRNTNWVLIDGNDEATEGTWLYQDGTPITYTKWESGHPHGGTGQNILALYDGQMRSAPTSYVYNGVACVWE